jgi:hypothetical protein
MLPPVCVALAPPTKATLPALPSVELPVEIESEPETPLDAPVATLIAPELV